MYICTILAESLAYFSTGKVEFIKFMSSELTLSHCKLDLGRWCYNLHKYVTTYNLYRLQVLFVAMFISEVAVIVIVCLRLERAFFMSK